MKKITYIFIFISAFFCANSQTLTDCENSVRTYLDSDGKPYMCILDHNTEVLFIKKIHKDTATYECVIFHKDSIKVDNNNGVVIFLGNNKRIFKKDGIVTLGVCDEFSRIFVYTATVCLTREDINILLEYPIVSVGFKNMYQVIDDGEDYKSDLFCLIVN